jgi:hypothetical protein
MTEKQFSIEDYNRLEDIKCEFENLLEEAKNILRQDAPNHINARARAYWIGQIEGALCGNSMCNMEDTLRELEHCIEDEEEEETSPD